MEKKKGKYKRELSKAKNIFGKLFLLIAKYIFLDCLFILLLILVLFGFFYYQYKALIRKAESQPVEKPFLLKEGDYQKVIKEWRENERRLKETDSKGYSDPFKKINSTSSASVTSTSSEDLL